MINIYHKPVKATLWRQPKLRQESKVLGCYRVVPYANVWRVENLDDRRDYRTFRYKHEALRYQLDQFLGGGVVL